MAIRKWHLAIPLLATAMTQTGCIVFGPGSATNPHLVERLNGVYALAIEEDRVHVISSKSFVITNDSPKPEARTVACGDRFEAQGYIVEYTYELLDVRDGVAIFKRHGVRTPDAYVIPFVLPPAIVHEFDVVAAASYDDHASEGSEKTRRD